MNRNGVSEWDRHLTCCGAREKKYSAMLIRAETVGLLSPSRVCGCEEVEAAIVM